MSDPCRTDRPHPWPAHSSSPTARASGFRVSNAKRQLSRSSARLIAVSDQFVFEDETYYVPARLIRHHSNHPDCPGIAEALSVPNSWKETVHEGRGTSLGQGRVRCTAGSAGDAYENERAAAYRGGVALALHDWEEDRTSCAARTCPRVSAMGKSRREHRSCLAFETGRRNGVQRPLLFGGLTSTGGRGEARPRGRRSGTRGPRPSAIHSARLSIARRKRMRAFGCAVKNVCSHAGQAARMAGLARRDATYVADDRRRIDPVVSCTAWLPAPTVDA